METSERKLIKGRGIPVPGDDIDTDRIIPARYLRMITFEELGKYAFQDERFDENGKPRPHPLNEAKFTGATIMIVNKNFGCGSSREHAPQSLMRMGIRAFIGESFAEIFSGNCVALGLPAARVSHEDAVKLQDLVTADPSVEISVDLETQTISAGSKKFQFTMPDSDRKSLIAGSWDSTAMLLANRSAIDSAATRIPYLNGYTMAKGAVRG